MISGLLRDFLGNFSTWGERYYFRMEGAHEVDVRWELLHKVRNAYARWDLKSHLACTLRENFGVVDGTLGHTRWMWGEVWKVILHAPCVRTLLWWRWDLVTIDGHEVRFESHLACTLHENFVLDVTSLMSQGQMMKICKIFTLYTFQMSSHVDVRWDLTSHLASTLHENFGVVELTLSHARWMQGEIWKDISHAPWWSWHLVMLDGRKVKFEKSSRMHLAWELCY